MLLEDVGDRGDFGFLNFSFDKTVGGKRIPTIFAEKGALNPRTKGGYVPIQNPKFLLPVSSVMVREGVF